MRIWIGVENFAKIESAKVCVDNYTLLVGPNNSGKTFLMQLIQGLGDKLVRLLDDDFVDILAVDKLNAYRKYEINEQNITCLTNYINEKLDENKEQLVQEIFGKSIAIDKLYIDICFEEKGCYQIDVLDEGFSFDEEAYALANQDLRAFVYSYEGQNGTNKVNVTALSKINKENKFSKLLFLSYGGINEESYRLKSVLRFLLEKKSLYLPASRTGLMLLYRDYFANKTDDAISYQIKDERMIENKERYGGLTQPIYEFLRFLQTYSPNEEAHGSHQTELAFFEEKLIEGHISCDKQGTFSYNSKKDGQMVSMHLASSMVNEVAPMVLALNSKRHYERLIIDEVEASLHPQKQHEMARFLNRLNNRGMKLLFSTHSDTFVSKLNNLYILSEYVKESENIEVLRQFDLEKEDLVETDKLFVYEFTMQPNGKSVVEQIIPNKKTGFQFGLFTKSAMNLYNEALKLGEIH